MDRRRFIRLVGGGMVTTSALGGLPGCSAELPAEALVAWQGPDNQADLRRWALGYAILAPNSHNRQPWLVDLREDNTITLYVDRQRMLPMTDPWFRQIMISQGTFLESLMLALRERGVAPLLELFPQGEFAARSVDHRAVARVSWAGAGTGTKDPLFAQLLGRQTAKVDYDTSRAVAPATLDALRDALTDPELRFGSTVDPALVQPLRQLCWDAARVELLTERTVMESLRLTRVGPAEISRYRDGISINELLPRVADMVGAFDRTNPPAEGSTAYKQMMGRFEGHSRSAMGFVWLSSTNAGDSGAGGSRSAQVKAGQAYLRLQLKATELGLQVHPMSQAMQEFAEMKPHYDRLHTLLLAAPAQEQTVQMFCRVGYCPAQAHTPRRALQDFIRA